MLSLLALHLYDVITSSFLRKFLIFFIKQQREHVFHTLR